MAIDHQVFLRRLAEVLVADAYDKAMPAVQDASFTLARYLTAEVEEDRPGMIVAALSVPHFWAKFLHDGRGPVRPQSASFLVWFRNVLDDPRLRGGRYPQRNSQVRHLTKQQWQFWLNENRLARARRVPEPMIVTKYSGPVTGKPFFSNEPDGGMYGFPNEANAKALRLTREHIQESLKRVMALKLSSNISVV